MNRSLTPLPVWLLSADMAYTFITNIRQSFGTAPALPPAEGLPVSPNIAFGSLQVAANGSMVLVIGFGLWVLLKLNRSVLQQQLLPIGVFSALGLAAVLAFSIPSLWQWAWALTKLADSRDGITAAPPRYLVAALCQPAVACLCLYRLAGWYRLYRQRKSGILSEYE